MSRKHIVFITHENSMTGAPLVLLQVIRHLRSALDIQPLIMSRDAQATPVLEQLRELGPVSLPGERPPGWPSAVDLIYSNTCTNGVFVSHLPWRTAPVVTHIHELTESISGYGRNNWNVVLRQSSAFIACSPTVRNHLVHNFAVPEDSVHLVPAFANTARMTQSLDDHESDDLIASWGDAFVIGGVGWASFRKGTDFFVSLLRHLPRQLNGRRVLLAWIGGNIDKYARAIPSADRDRFVALGPRRNPYPFFSRFDVFALPSREDPFPVVMLEAGWFSRPIVGFAGSGGLDDFAGEGGALAVPLLNTERFVSALSLLALDDRLARRLGERARSLVLSRYTSDVCLPAIADLVGRWLSFPPHGTSPQCNRDGVWLSLNEIRSDRVLRGCAEVFYGSDPGASVKIEYDRSSAASLHASFNVPAGPLQLRIDPDYIPGLFSIQSLVLSDADGTILFSRGSDLGWADVFAAGHARLLSADGDLRIASFGRDPQIVLAPISTSGGLLTLEFTVVAEVTSDEFSQQVEQLAPKSSR